ncbi:hypothetical protein B4Q04_20565 [Zobellia sp. OII3]|nr:hypothetical protein B4Q04_20565 [Zobellia sp. OII3]
MFTKVLLNLLFASGRTLLQLNSLGEDFYIPAKIGIFLKVVNPYISRSFLFFIKKTKTLNFSRVFLTF